MNTNTTFPPLSRRDMLRRCGGGFGLLGLAGLMHDERLLGSAALGAPSLAGARALNPMAPQASHFAPRAKAVIWVFVNGGPSQVDTWDYKPALEKLHGQKLDGFDPETGFFKNQVGALMKSPFNFRPRGHSGKMVSDIFPHLGEHVDKMAFLHAGHTTSNNHSPALFMMNCGRAMMGLPCVGSWVTYGLGSESKNLPGFVVMSDPLGRGLPKGHAANWGAAFLPGAYQGTWLQPTGEPIPNLKRPGVMSDAQQRAQLDFLKRMNGDHRASLGGEAELEARIESFELAYRMQMAAPEALDIEAEPEHIRAMYGVNDKKCAHFARQCLLARRLVERGVRMVQIYSGGMENQRSWDGHADIAGNHAQFAGETDQPVAALLADLDQRGMLEETLVIWAGEFGRLPIAQTGAKPGRDHNPHCFTAWFAGGGVKAGTSFGASDDVGFKADTGKVTVHDMHATILHLLGIDHEKLSYRYQGFDWKLTGVEEPRVIHEIVA